MLGGGGARTQASTGQSFQCVDPDLPNPRQQLTVLTASGFGVWEWLATERLYQLFALSTSCAPGKCRIRKAVQFTWGDVGQASQEEHTGFLPRP